MDLTDKSQLIKYLKENGLWAKHGLGQNFLIDKNALDKIIEAAGLTSPQPSPCKGEGELVIEVGPGLGTLTAELVERAGKVIAVELDEKLAELLSDRMSKSELQMPKYCHPELVTGSKTLDSGSPVRQAQGGERSRIHKLTVRNDSLCELEIVNADILSVNIPELVGNQKYKVVANIPYYITSKIIRLFLEQDNKPERMVMLVQKEVAERICAKKGDMSVLAISVQAYSEASIVDIVPAESFFPSPEVDSAILELGIMNKELWGDKEEEKEFFRLVNIGFASRRKTLVNNLSAGYHIDKKAAADIIKAAELSENIRAQELGIEDWKKLLQKFT